MGRPRGLGPVPNVSDADALMSRSQKPPAWKLLGSKTIRMHHRKSSRSHAECAQDSCEGGCVASLMDGSASLTRGLGKC